MEGSLSRTAGSGCRWPEAGCMPPDTSEAEGGWCGKFAAKLDRQLLCVGPADLEGNECPHVLEYAIADSPDPRIAGDRLSCVRCSDSSGYPQNKKGSQLPGRVALRPTKHARMSFHSSGRSDSGWRPRNLPVHGLAPAKTHIDAALGEKLERFLRALVAGIVGVEAGSPCRRRDSSRTAESSDFEDFAHFHTRRPKLFGAIHVELANGRQDGLDHARDLSDLAYAPAKALGQLRRRLEDRIGEKAMLNWEQPVVALPLHPVGAQRILSAERRSSLSSWP